MRNGRAPVIAPSLLAADAADLRSAVASIESRVDAFHVDVMDGHFVPNISMGPAVPQGLRACTDKPLDVHLMVESPELWIARYREAGADWISIHAEATRHLEGAVALIRDAGARAGVALNPATTPAGLEHVLRPGDFVVVMSVNPGFGGQRFLASAPARIADVREFLDAHGLQEVVIEVDGGVDSSNAGACAAAGAEIFVAGSSVFGQSDAARACDELRAAAVAGS